MSVLSGQAIRTTTLKVCICAHISIIYCYTLSRMGVDHGGEIGGQVPQNLERGDANTNCPPPRFCHIGLGTKMSVLWPSKYAKIRFRQGSAPDPAGGAHDAPPDPLVGWREDTPPHMPPHSTRTQLRRSPCIPPRISARSTPMLNSTVFLKRVTYTAYGVLTFRPLEHLNELDTEIIYTIVRTTCSFKLCIK